MENICVTCRSPTAQTQCKLCENPLCRDCVLCPPNGSFTLQSKIPVELTHAIYCRFCFDEKVQPALTHYEETLERAKNVFVFFTTQRKEVPLIKKAKTTLTVKECMDRDETILRLAFMSADQGFNALIDTEVEYQKIRNHAHQKTHWSGSGVPAQIDEGKLDRQFKRNQIYR